MVYGKRDETNEERCGDVGFIPSVHSPTYIEQMKLKGLESG